nr:FISUMP domain-containing protein [uncultured Desulfobulbus sp.]
MKKIVFTCCILILSGLGSAAADTQKKKNLSPVIYLLLSDSAPDLDCNSDLGGSAYIDSCGICVGGNTGKTASEVSCITSTTGQVWMDRNLGASRVAQSLDDEEAYGDLYQWGRGTDGHEKRDSQATDTLSSTDTPGHGYFIETNAWPMDWRETQNGNLWQGASGINNPCPSGFRLPTYTEWYTELLEWPNRDSQDAFDSALKLVLAGLCHSYQSKPSYMGSVGVYWTSSAGDYFSSYMMIEKGYADMDSAARAQAFSVRCIKD